MAGVVLIQMIQTHLHKLRMTVPALGRLFVREMVTLVLELAHVLLMVALVMVMKIVLRSGRVRTVLNAVARVIA